MKSFISEDFLLTTEAARRLYHEHAERMPIFDYHCHLNPKEIYDNKQFADIGEAWLQGITTSGASCVPMQCLKST